MVHTSRMTNVIMALTLLWAASQSKPLSAASLNLPDVPLVVSTTVSPNIMLLLDNSGSMSNIVPDTPYNANTTYPPPTCTGSNALNNGIAYTDTEPNVDILVSSGGTPSFLYNGSIFSWGTSTGQKCFIPTRTYNARLVADLGVSPAQPGSYLDATYTGNYLNWYFGSLPTNWGIGARRKPGTLQRIEIARTAAKQLVDSLINVRIGLATYDSSNGDNIIVGVNDLDGVQKTLLKTAIDALIPSGSTPLAESLQDIGLYFVQGFNNKQLPLSSRWNRLPVKRINGSRLMRHEHLARSLVELMQIGKTPSGANSVLHHTTKTFNGIEVVSTMGWQEMQPKLLVPVCQRRRELFRPVGYHCGRRP